MSYVPRRFLACLFFFALVSSLSFAQQPDLSHTLRWRNVGPFRGGRTRAVAGIPSQMYTFYIGVVNGGVWKTVDAGRTWQPIFDDQPTGSIGAVAVAPSDPNTIYVGSGEGLHRPDLSVGDGVYKSNDGGRTWKHLGLRDGQQIRSIAVDAHDPNLILVSVVGHPYGPNAERGIFRSTDGGQNFEKVLYKDENVGGGDLVVDPSNPQTVYGSLWEAREGPWENGSWNGNGGGLYRSTDFGKTWQQIGTSIPGGVTQANVAVSATNPRRLFASIAAQDNSVKIYRSDDGGSSWNVITDDPRPAARIGGGDLPVMAVDPKNPDTVYATSTVVWKSSDGGKTWSGFRGAPGGDDYQNIWINPNDTGIILLASDQGAIVTLDAGETWSSWYNQPTAQLYHVSADNAFPYRLCSGQQESGSVCIASRGSDGAVTFRDWHPVAAEEYGYVAPDPLDADIVYGGKLSRYDRRTTQVQDVSPVPMRSGDFRVVRTEPVLFSPIDKHTLYFASNVLWKTNDGGKTWTKISGDPTRKTYEVPSNVGKFSSEQTAQPRQRGVIYAVGPSPLDIKRIWIGTDDGVIQLTSDGGANWKDVTPKQLVPFAKVSILEPSHFDPQTAYAAINTLRLDDLRPHILRTRDGGATWTEIVNGLGDSGDVNAVREDPKHKGLLFAGTEREVYVSYDDGDHWQSLRLNMPATSVRDLLIKDDDLVAATHGRGFWILDDIEPLRQMQSAGQTALLKPATAMRIRWNTNSDTPLPPDEPLGENPPDGAAIDYVLAGDNGGPVTLDILDRAGDTVRHFSSTDVPPKIERLDVPEYWLRPPQTLAAAAGMHRFFWDLHYTPLNLPPQLGIAAVPHNTAPSPSSPWVMPGQYTVRLTANGRTYSQPLTVVLDPRVKTAAADLQRQFDISRRLYSAAVQMDSDANAATSLLDQLRTAKASAQAADAQQAIGGEIEKITALRGGAGRGRRGGGGQPDSLTAERGALLGVLSLVQSADAAPTAALADAAEKATQAAPALHQRWEALMSQDIPALNRQLEKSGLPKLR